MPLELPPALAAFFASERDPALVATAFAADAIVGDERQSHKGITEITAWRSETSTRYGQTSEPLALAEAGGRTVVTTRVSGNFPGSPVTLEHAFTLRDGKIVRLEIS